MIIDNFRVKNCTQSLLDALEVRGPNFYGTPDRVARVWAKLFSTPEPDMTTFPLEGKGGMLFIKDHIAFSFCPHHLLPIEYRFKIGYIPEDRVLGLSKLARIADYCVRDLPLQEDIAFRIAKMVDEAIKPKGVGVIIEGQHMCMRMRGVESPCATAVSTFMMGVFLTEGSAREEFIQL